MSSKNFLCIIFGYYGKFLPAPLGNEMKIFFFNFRAYWENAGEARVLRAEVLEFSDYCFWSYLRGKNGSEMEKIFNFKMLLISGDFEFSSSFLSRECKIF